MEKNDFNEPVWHEQCHLICDCRECNAPLTRKDFADIGSISFFALILAALVFVICCACDICPSIK